MLVGSQCHLAPRAQHQSSVGALGGVTLSHTFSALQILDNDLKKRLCVAESVVCVVVDECHRATGKHQYVTGVARLLGENPRVRIIGLSATPGADAKSVQEVIDALHVESIAFRAEDDPDVAPYRHEKKIDVEVVGANDQMKDAMSSCNAVCESGLRASMCARRPSRSALTPSLAGAAHAAGPSRGAGSDAQQRRGGHACSRSSSSPATAPQDSAGQVRATGAGVRVVGSGPLQDTRVDSCRASRAVASARDARCERVPRIARPQLRSLPRVTLFKYFTKAILICDMREALTDKGTGAAMAEWDRGRGTLPVVRDMYSNDPEFKKVSSGGLGGRARDSQAQLLCLHVLPSASRRLVCCLAPLVAPVVGVQVGTRSRAVRKGGGEHGPVRPRQPAVRAAA